MSRRLPICRAPCVEDDAVSDEPMPNPSFEDRATEIAATIKVVADHHISDAHWPMACADALCALVRADDCAIARHTPGGPRVDGRAARRLTGVQIGRASC